MQHTAAIIGDNTANVDETDIKTDPFKFKITVTETTKVTLEPRWGTVVEPDIENSALIDKSNNSNDANDANQSIEQ